jgi:hypothetical protein
MKGRGSWSHSLRDLIRWGTKITQWRKALSVEELGRIRCREKSDDSVEWKSGDIGLGLF